VIFIAHINLGIHTVVYIYKTHKCKKGAETRQRQHADNYKKEGDNRLGIR